MKQIPTLAQLIKQAINNQLLDVHTALIGRIEKYDASSQLADIQPLAKHASEQENLPLLVDVPILFPRAGGFFISLPIQVGDFIQIIFNESNIDDFLTESVSTINPTSRFSLQGAIAIPGIYPFSKAIHEAHKVNLVIGKDNGPQVHIDDEKIRLGSEKADKALAIASSVKNELEKIRSAFQTHVHTYHSTPTTTQIIPIGNLGTTKVMAE
jgi:hypothetical protein